jgi:hypothetical protein
MGRRAHLRPRLRLRAVTSVDGMTADFYPFDMAFIGRVATRIINEVKGINRVTYDITSKAAGDDRVGVTPVSGTNRSWPAFAAQVLGDRCGTFDRDARPAVCRRAPTSLSRSGASTSPRGSGWRPRARSQGPTLF